MLTKREFMRGAYGVLLWKHNQRAAVAGLLKGAAFGKAHVLRSRRRGFFSRFGRRGRFCRRGCLYCGFYG